MGHCIEKIEHSCGTHDGLQVFENDGKYDGYCFSCHTWVPDPYGDKPKNFKPKKLKASPDQLLAEMAVIARCQSHTLDTRKLNADALDYFGVKVGVSEQDGKTPTCTFFPYDIGDGVAAYKARLLAEKRMWVVGSIKNVNLFGWKQAIATGAKTLYITEGEYDAVALYQALKKKSKGSKWEDYNPAIISLISGSSSAKRDLTQYANSIRALFKDIVFVFDQDEAGNKATEEALQIFPEGRSVVLPGKDANECVIEGRSMALANAVLFKAEAPKNTRLVWGSEMYEAGRKHPEFGLPWPWEGMTELTRGMRFGETIYLGAGVKMGKSEMVNTLAAHLMVNHGLKVFLAKPEEANPKTYKMVLGKVEGRFFHDPTVEFDDAAYDRASAKVGDNLCMLNLYQHLGWNSLRADILAAVEQGCRAVFIDPITNLVNGIASGETNTILQEIAQELAALAKDLDILIFIFCHLKAPESGPAHERGGKVLSHQFAGSRAMMRSCNMMLGLEGDKNPDLEIEMRNMRRLVILEDREFGATGAIPLYWDKKTGLFNEVKTK
jgi:twinkle protein